MLNGAARKRAIADLKSTHERFVDHVGLLTEAARRLAEVREHTAEKVIARCEQEEARQEAEGVNLKAGTGAAAGVGAGVATLAFGPSAAMAFATTFGTASTGTAISSLSGAAATNAALAWLGGGVAVDGRPWEHPCSTPQSIPRSRGLRSSSMAGSAWRRRRFVIDWC